MPIGLLVNVFPKTDHSYNNQFGISFQLVQSRYLFRLIALGTHDQIASA